MNAKVVVVGQDPQLLAETPRLLAGRLVVCPTTDYDAAYNTAVGDRKVVAVLAEHHPTRRSAIDLLAELSRHPRSIVRMFVTSPEEAGAAIKLMHGKIAHFNCFLPIDAAQLKPLLTLADRLAMTAA